MDARNQRATDGAGRADGHGCRPCIPSRHAHPDPRLSHVPIATFPTLDEAEGALDWIGLDVAEADRTFVGTLAGGDRELLEAAVADPESPPPVRDLARALLARWNADGADSLTFSVAWDERAG